MVSAKERKDLVDAYRRARLPGAVAAAACVVGFVGFIALAGIVPMQASGEGFNASDDRPAPMYVSEVVAPVVP